MFCLESARVGLRKFRDDDLDAFAAMHEDPVVMEFFPAPLDRNQCEQYMARINAKIDEQGFGFWAAEHLETAKFMGFVGMTRVAYETEFTPAVEVGWRLAREFWGRGLATEAAKACLKFGFEVENLEELVSFTALKNRRSYAVMERIGMTRDMEFDHPKIEDGHPLQRHILYKIRRSEFEKAR